MLFDRFCLGLVQVLVAVSHAGLADTVGQTDGTALGASGDAGIGQLPHGRTTLIPTLLGNFTLRDCHG